MHQVKKVANQTKGGKKRTVSALVVVGNGSGMAGISMQSNWAHNVSKVSIL